MEPLTPTRARQSGTTLVELMISITLGLIILAALVYVYVGSSRSYRVNENLARVQESGRFALDYLSQDLRMASFAGCRSRNLNGDSEMFFNITDHPVVDYSGGDAVTGYENGTGWTNPSSIAHAAGDVFTARRASSLTIPVTSHADLATRSFTTLNNLPGIVKNDLVVLANCEYAVLFRVTNDPAPTPPCKHPTTFEFGAAGNLPTPTLPHLREDSRLEALRFGSYSYFVGRTPSGLTALYRTDGNLAEAIVDGVIDMDLQFALDDSVPADGVVERYLTAAAIKSASDWRKVTGVRVSLLVASEADGVTSNPMSYALRDTNGDGKPDLQTATDRRLYQVFTTTIALRNRSL